MNKLELLKMKQKRKNELERINEFFSENFGVEFMGYHEVDTFSIDYSMVTFGTYNNSIEGFHTLPSAILSTAEGNDKAIIVLRKMLFDFLSSESLFLYYEVPQLDIYGFLNFNVGISNDLFFRLLDLTDVYLNQLWLTQCFDKFCYFLPNKSGSSIYVYKGEVIDEKYTLIKYD